MTIRWVKLVSKLIHLVQKLRTQKFLSSTSAFIFSWFIVPSYYLFQLFISPIEYCIKQLLRKLIFISVSKSSSTVIDRRTRMIYQKNSSFSLRYCQKLVFGMIFTDSLRQILIRLVQFWRLVDKMKETQRIYLKKINHWFVVLKIYL